MGWSPYARAYGKRLAGIVPTEGVIRMLDFGCGSGSFTVRFLQQAGWPPARLLLMLIEPVESARRQAIARLAGYTEHPVVEAAALPGGAVARFDIILANRATGGRSFAYLALLMDLYSRRTVGWEVDEHMTEALGGAARKRSAGGSRVTHRGLCGRARRPRGDRHEAAPSSLNYLTPCEFELGQQ
jgi:hypothetical protein